MSSLAEAIFDAVKTRLEGIQGAPDYSLTIASVQRYRTEDQRGQILGNERAARPMILLRWIQTSVSAEETLDIADKTLVVGVELLLDDPGTGEDLAAADRDIEKALTQNLDDDGGLGAGVTHISGVSQQIDLETGLPYDGVQSTWTFTYQNDLGDPDHRTG